MTTDCQQCRDELAEFALGQCEPTVAARIDEHLRACVVCRYELAELERDWTLLAAAAQPASAPAELFDRIAEKCWHGAGKASGKRDRTLAPAADSQFKADASATLSAGQRFASYALAVSVLIAVTWGSAASLGLLSRTPVRDRGQVAAQELLRGLADVEQFERLADGRDVRLVAATGREPAGRARAVIAWDLVARQWHFYALDLPPAPEGKEYQLWIQPVGQKPPIPGPRLNVNERGVAQALVNVPDLDPTERAHARVTLEDASGAKEPAGATVIDAEI